ncbi:hypothetical protein OS493_014585 [Desmophyllum pertusum]|uniref:Uncharacterized protein n=1 Tax=Desmophyllum pertusum TaxID=174260 RepID=A0A9W9YSP4_9CNID|nr:hypothetical protein OS493_014585 [Desmophyllum pertusum]
MSKSVSNPRSTTKTNWAQCAICQANKEETLRCPADSKRSSDIGAGYKTLAANIAKFNDLGCMPTEFDLSRLDEGGGLESTFLRCKARWHKSCYDQFNSTKLKRAEKRCALEHEQPCRSMLHNYVMSVVRNNNPLPNVSTLGIDARVRKCAFALQDEKLLAQLSAGDLVALEAKYHAPCLASLYKKAGTIRDGDEEDEMIPRRPEGIALAELVSYIEESRMASAEELPVFKLAELADKYTSRLAQLGESKAARIHTTRLKDRILSHIPALEEHKQGRDVFLAFKKDLANATAESAQGRL